ncbi:kinesin-domain-containing protein [Phanerochaete sordida]|uniref:Kinesin-like protein n=1 Tax=Phanerochaete sordida TaxID=48140 RepID=A0A9P3G1C1_9APHY|nr:kinesin-domain-containing protein [Phanerochaete sordida]
MKRSTTRKPLANRDNSPGRKSPASANPQPKAAVAKSSSQVSVIDDGDREPIRAFLRIRPQAGEDDETMQSKPYLEPISNTAVRMSDPNQSSNLPVSRLSTVPPSSTYTFSHIFPPATNQSDFFAKTTLPLVKDVLEGQSGLIFAYGVTNSGKTYTVQGGREEGSAGILPRTLDVVFNSIEGLHGDGRFRPVRLQGIEAALPDFSASRSSAHDSYTSSGSSPALADILADLPPEDPDTDPTTLKLDRNHEYTIWLSYAEVYNEKVYDLFASVDDGSPSSAQPTGASRPTSTFLNMPAGSNSKPLLLTRKALPVKPCPPSDNDSGDGTSGGKYVAGLRQIRVTSAAQAKALLRLGQMHRQVFGTLANSQSSRSHALVTLKVLRVHRGERNDPSSIQTSRLTLVDLAGSERTKHTQTTGDRLREAGNINKSLMVLGQCMETMRNNQRAVARSLAPSQERMDTRDVKRGLAVVPFRHSKLTEVLMDYFVGEGRVVMIVNVNPYDTGFDENSHVMKFSSLAREVSTAAPTAVSRALPTLPPHLLQQARTKSLAALGRASDIAPHRRKVTISTGGRGGRVVSETHLEVLEEDEERGDDDEDDDEPINPLVDALFDEIESLRMQLFESEMRCAMIEADTREEVIQEMEERMQLMEKTWNRRLMKQMEQNELKMDAKIDMLQRSAMLGRAAVPVFTRPEQAEKRVEEEPDEDEMEEEDEIEKSLVEDDAESELSDVPSEVLSSPLTAKDARNRQRSPHARVSNKQSVAASASGSIAEDESDEIESFSETGDEEFPEEDEDDDFDEIEDDSDEEWNGIGSSTRSKSSRGKKAAEPVKAQTKAAPASKSKAKKDQVPALVQKTERLSLDHADDGADSDDSVVVRPSRKIRSSVASAASVEQPQKKRQLSKKTLVTEEEVERAAEDSGRPVRRNLRGSSLR